MVPADLRGTLTPGIVTATDPPTTVSGMINIRLDSNGKLLYLQVMPPQKEEGAAAAKAIDWKPLFAAAGLDISQFQTATPQWVSLAAFDERAAWTGKWPDIGLPLRVEAAAWHGKAVYFELIGPWTRPERMHASEVSQGTKIGQILGLVLFFFIPVGAATLARRQYKQGKSDRVGAARLSAFVFLAQIAIWLCYGHFVPSLELTGPFVLAISTGLFTACLVWVLYMALEPYVRRLWPQTIISWTRLMSGRVRDPLVGRDVMFGVILGLIWTLIIEVRLIVGATRFGMFPQLFSKEYLMGGRSTLGVMLGQVPGAIQGTLVFFIILIALRSLLRNRWAGAAGFVVIFAVLKGLGSSHPLLEMATGVLIYGIAAVALVRFGLITLAVAVFVANTMLNVPVTFDFSRWYASTAMIVPLGVLALGIWGFYTALGGQKLIKEQPGNAP